LYFFSNDSTVVGALALFCFSHWWIWFFRPRFMHEPWKSNGRSPQKQTFFYYWLYIYSKFGHKKQNVVV